MEIIKQFVDIILHLDKHLNDIVASYGTWSYLLMFLIVFCETGLVVTPFLPGDSLLFALGALSASEGSVLNVWWLGILLITAGIIGDAVNYSIGRYLGPKAFHLNTRFLKKEYLTKTQEFYNKHGGKTIILARYVPIIRTFAPFVAGVGEMKYSKFFAYNVIGAITWVCIFLWAGHAFGGQEYVKKNFHVVIFGIIGVSLLPMIVEIAKAKMQKQKA